jgi:hypothetical protein
MGWFRPRSVPFLHHPKEVQDDEYDGNDDQRVDPTSGSRESWADIPAEKAEKPQYYQDDDDSPQHEIFPLMNYWKPPGYQTGWMFA